MDQDNKRILKNTVYLYIRMLFLLAINLLVSRWILQLLGISDYGVYQVVGGIVALFSVINGALSSGSSRFITIELGKGNFERLKKVFNTSFESHCILAIIIFVLAETVGLWYVNTYMEIPDGRLGAANWIYQFSIVSCMLSITQVPYSADIIGHERMDIYAYVGIAEGLFKLLLVGLMFLCRQADLLILYGAMNTAWSISLQIYYRWFCYKKYPETHLIIVKDKKLFKEIVGFSFWDVIGSFTVNGNYQGVNLLITKFFGVVYNAAYGVTSSVNNVLNQFVNNFMTATSPQITKDFARGDIGKMKRLVYNASKMGFILYCFIGIPFFMEANYILNLWLKEVPPKTTIFLQLTIITCLIRAFARPVITAVHASGNIKQLNIYSGGQSVALTIPLTFIFYECGLPVESSYFVLILTSFIANYVELYCLRREIPEYGIWEYTYKVYFPCIVMCLITFAVDTAFTSFVSPSFLRLCATVLVNAIMVTLLSAVFVISKQQRQEIISKVKVRITKKVNLQ